MATIQEVMIEPLTAASRLPASELTSSMLANGETFFQLGIEPVIELNPDTHGGVSLPHRRQS